MKKKTIVFLSASLCFLALVLLHAASPNSPTTISKIELQPGPLAARLVLQTDGQLIVDQAYYHPQFHETLIIDVANAATAETPIVPPSEALLIKDIQVQKTGPQDLRFYLQLQERVPCRIFSDTGRTVVELNKIVRDQAGYVIDPNAQSLLDRRNGGGDIYLNDLVTSQGPDGVSFRAELTGQAVTQVFALENPSRLVVDIFDTVLRAKKDIIPVSNPQSSVQRVRLGQFQLSNPRAITRMVFDLVEPGFYSLDSNKDELVVSFFKSEPPPAPREEVSKPEPTPPPPPPKAEPKTVPKAEAKAEAAPPVRTVTNDTLCPPREARIPQQEAKETLAEEQQDKFRPRTIVSEESAYSGEIVSLKLKDADLRDVILYLAEVAGLNVVFDPDVRGIVTCNLQEVPWDQALDLILKQNKMGKTIEGNVLRIASIGVLTREEEDQRKLKESRELAGPLQVKTVTLSYSKANDVKALLETKISSRGEIIVDSRTNTLLISEVRDKLELLEKLIEVVDTPTPQVSIEARVVEATTTFIRNLGIQWGFRGIADPFYGNQTSVLFPNKVLVDGALIPTGIVTKGIGGPLGGYAINLPAPAFNTALGFSFANVLDTFRLDVALSALETAGDGKIISSPKVTTQNNQEAEIIQGRQIPVQTVANFTVTTRYVNAALELRATPQITAEGTIIMTVEIQNNAADFANLVNGIPPITTQSAKTTVMVPDGGTTVIGGIYRTEDSVTRNRVPFLHQIPILGSIFKSFARTKQTRELLIFLTPRIIK
jgi:type IV pilus secretin PilQ/predicted competence protein